MTMEALAEYDTLHRGWSVEVINLGLKYLGRYSPTIPGVVRTGGFIIGTPWEPGSFTPVLETFDIDHTVTDMKERKFMRNFAHALGRENTRFKKIYEAGTIDIIIEAIYKTFGLRSNQSYRSPQQEFGNALHEARVTLKNIMDATGPAVKETPLAPGFIEGYEESKSIGILGSTCSANLDIPVGEFSDQKMTIPKILARGAESIFDENDVFTEMISNVGYQKYENLRRLAEQFNNNAELFLYVADTSLISDKPEIEPEWPVFASLGTALGIAIKKEQYEWIRAEWERKKKAFIGGLYDIIGRTFEESKDTWMFGQVPGEIVLASAAIRDNFALYMDPTKAWLSKKFITAIVSPVDYAARCEDQQMLNALRLELEKENPHTFARSRQNILDIVAATRATFVPFFDEMATSIDRYLLELDRYVQTRDTKRQIKVIDDIIIDLNRVMAERHYTKPEVMRLRTWANQIEEWRKRFPKLRPGPRV